jgi:hypothetical protein
MTSMRNRVMAAALVLACSGLAWGGDELRLDAPPALLADKAAPAPSGAAVAAPTPPSDRRPLMRLLDQAGVGKTLDQWGLAIYGHADAGYTYNFDDPSSELNPFRIFDFEHDDPTFNQLDLTVERAVSYRDAAKRDKWDVGFRMEWLYGADASIIHSNGLFDWYDGIRSPENQWDLFQAYVDVVVPLGTGLRVRFGKFANFVGYESVNPTTGGIVDFYSRSLTFFNYPFTHTGILFTYDIAHNVTLTAGISRGDNQSTEDNNDSIAFLGSINWVINDQWALYVSNSTGPEKTDNNSDYRVTLDGTLFFIPTKQFTSAFNAYYVWEQDSGDNGDDAQLIALSLLAAYDLNRYITLKGRAEWIHDDDGFRLGAGVSDIYELTVGLTIHPFPNDPWGRNIKVRPEIRWDHSPDEAFNGDDDQVTGGIDVVVTF